MRSPRLRGLACQADLARGRMKGRDTIAWVPLPADQGPGV